MNLDQLTTFRTVVRLRSFQKAADSLHLTQPAVSKQIRALENEIGERLLERRLKGRLTPAGEVLLKYTEGITQMLQAAREELNDITAHGKGRLAIGVSHSIALYLLPSLLKTYRARYPRVALSIETRWPAEIMHRVAAADLDLGLVVLVTPKPNNSLLLRCVPLVTTEIVFVASPTDPIVKRKEVTIDDLQNAAWILNHDGCQYRSYLEKKFGERGLAPNIAVEVMDREMQKKLAQLGLGATLLPKPFVAQELKEGRLKRFKVKGIKLQSFSCIVYRRDKYIHGAMQGFLGLLREVFAKNYSSLRVPATSATSRHL